MGWTLALGQLSVRQPGPAKTSHLHHGQSRCKVRSGDPEVLSPSGHRSLLRGPKRSFWRSRAARDFHHLAIPGPSIGRCGHAGEISREARVGAGPLGSGAGPRPPAEEPGFAKGGEEGAPSPYRTSSARERHRRQTSANCSAERSEAPPSPVQAKRCHAQLRLVTV